MPHSAYALPNMLAFLSGFQVSTGSLQLSLLLCGLVLDA